MKYIPEPARTLQELMIYPASVPIGIHEKGVCLKTPLARFNPNKEESRFYANNPLIAAIMQALAGPKLLAELSIMGGFGFTPSSIPLKDALDVFKATKRIKAGFVEDFTSVDDETTLEKIVDIRKAKDHSTMPVIRGDKLVGIITRNDYLDNDNPDTRAMNIMSPFVAYNDRLNIELVNGIAEEREEYRKKKEWDKLYKLENSPEYQSIVRVIKSSPFLYGLEGLTLKGSNLLLTIGKKSCLPIIDNEENRKLKSLVFRKDYVAHANNPFELTDSKKRPFLGVGLNTWDYKERVEEFKKEGATLFCFDSSHVTGYQIEAVRWIKKNHPELIVGGGNVIAEDMFLELADADIDFEKAGIGGGSICITREQQAVGVGQGTAIKGVAEPRDNYFRRTGHYIPIISDGSIVYDHDIIIALALGADAVMMGRYFARFEENPWPEVRIKDIVYKPYWGEGSLKARNWQRYGATAENFVQQGVDGFVPCVGKLRVGVEESLKKLRKTMIDYLGATTLRDFTERAIIRPGSEAAMREAKDHDILKFEDMGLLGSGHNEQKWGA